MFLLPTHVIKFHTIAIEIFIVTPYNNTMENAQTEALDILQEECGELIVILSKVKRFGLMSENPEAPGVSARQRLVQEIGDVLALADLMCRHHHIGTLEIEFAKQRKFDKLKLYSKHLGDTP